MNEGNVLFNNALYTFYLRLYGIKNMVKDHSDSERANPLPSTRATLFDKQKGFFYMYHPTDWIIHTTTFVTPVVEHWLEREIAQWVHSVKDRSDDPSHHERNALTTELYISLLKKLNQRPSVYMCNIWCLQTSKICGDSCLVFCACVRAS